MFYAIGNGKKRIRRELAHSRLGDPVGAQLKLGVGFGTGRGNPWLKWIVIDILQALKLAPGPVGGHYEKLLRAKGKPKATVAAARRFCLYVDR